MKNILPILVILFFSFSIKTTAQSAQKTGKEETERLVALQKKLEGTYQIQVIDSREKVAFPLSTLDVIETKRTKTDTIYFWLKERVRIMVLPANELNKVDFKPLTNTVYISSDSSK